MEKNVSTSNFVTVDLFSHPTRIKGYQITACQQDEEGVSYFEGTALFMGAVIGLMNMIVVIVIARGGRKLRKPTFFCICNLAVADMLAGLLLLWIFGLQKIILPFRAPLSELIQKSIWAMTMWSSILSQVVISVDRFLCITCRKEGSKTSSRLKRLIWKEPLRRNYVSVGIVLTWLIPILSFVIPVTTSSNCSSSCNCYKPVNETAHVYFMFCTPINSCSLTNPPFTKASMLYLSLSLLLLPIIPCVLYLQVFRHVKNSANKCKTVNNRPSFSSDSIDDSTRSLPRESYNNYEKDISPLSNKIARLVSFSPIVALSRDKSSQVAFTYEKPHIFSTSTKNADKTIDERQGYLFNKSNEEKRNSSRSSEDQTRLKQLISTNGVVSRTFSKFRRRRRELRLLQTLVIILAVLLISTIPLGVLFFASYTETDKRYVSTAKNLLVLSLINSLVNPWIYFWRFTEMRLSLKNMFSCYC